MLTFQSIFTIVFCPINGSIVEQKDLAHHNHAIIIIIDRIWARILVFRWKSAFLDSDTFSNKDSGRMFRVNSWKRNLNFWSGTAKNQSRMSNFFFCASNKKRSSLIDFIPQSKPRNSMSSDAHHNHHQKHYKADKTKNIYYMEKVHVQVSDHSTEPWIYAIFNPAVWIKKKVDGNWIYSIMCVRMACLSETIPNMYHFLFYFHILSICPQLLHITFRSPFDCKTNQIHGVTAAPEHHSIQLFSHEWYSSFCFIYCHAPNPICIYSHLPIISLLVRVTGGVTNSSAEMKWQR